MVETKEHIFVRCKIALDIWIDILKWWNITNVHLNNLYDVIHLADYAPIASKHSRFFDVVVQTTIWALWKFRNDSTFSMKRPRKDLIFSDVKLLSFTWVSSRCEKPCLNWIEWFNDPCNALSTLCNLP